MVNLKKTRSNTKKRILHAALAEFSSNGFSGARMEKIARRAGINKALLFYHFSSKENLYREVLKHTVQTLVPQVRAIIFREDEPESFLEKLPPVYIRFFADNRAFIRMMAFDFVQHTDMIRATFEETIGREFLKGPQMLLKKIGRWRNQGKISEKDPLHFIINIISLCLFAFIARPLIEVIFDVSLDGDSFTQRRIDSVIQILKRGMLS